ncbi:DCC1-like thiol-disulfide oxidoreductase family protein [Exiguobacterium antarcticum]|uniref:DCC1-like thiol-disulfide oxidoreductase family protein n=1 Tax=Exiguobacterium antarcticum TaxID=132920 RepID=UPI000285EFF3|nr:hypothetical protein Eab7_0197 [Exiguobacterium antarcticum B7]
MRQLTVYFDGWCPLCQKSKWFLERLDRFDQLTFIDARRVHTTPVLGVLCINS